MANNEQTYAIGIKYFMHQNLQVMKIVIPYDKNLAEGKFLLSSKVLNQTPIIAKETQDYYSLANDVTNSKKWCEKSARTKTADELVQNKKDEQSSNVSGDTFSD